MLVFELISITIFTSSTHKKILASSFLQHALQHAFAFLASASTAFAADAAPSLRSRTLTAPDPECASKAKCYLINLETGTPTRIRRGRAMYNSADSSHGFSVKCMVSGGKVDYVKFKNTLKATTQYFSSERYHESAEQPFWLDGDNNGARVNEERYLEQCGPHEIEVEFFTWEGGDPNPCFDKTITLINQSSKCTVPPPTKAPVSTCEQIGGGCGSGESCCNDLSCQWTTGGHRRCLPPVPPPGQCSTLLTMCQDQYDSSCCNGLSCQETLGHKFICLPHHSIPKQPWCMGTSGGCGSGETCCPGLDCQWSPGSHRTCLPPCIKEHNTCSSESECCTGLACEHGRCIQKPVGKSCQHPVFGDIAHGQCSGKTLEGQCLVLCCTDGRINVRYSPIALDIDGSGLVERIQMGHVKFDINGNGELEDLHEWFAPTEGILVNTNVAGGEVLTGKHLFGDEGGTYRNGFDKLALLDMDGDGIVSGDELSGLKLWFDKNLNAFLDTDEMKELHEFGIVSLSLQEEQMVGHATLNDGSFMRMEDLWFEGEDVTMD